MGFVGIFYVQMGTFWVQKFILIPFDTWFLRDYEEKSVNNNLL